MQSEKTNSLSALPEKHADSWSRRVLLSGGRNRWKILAIILVLLAIIVFVFSPKKKLTAEEEKIVVSVKVAKAERGSIAAEVTALGTIFGRKEATVSSKIAAQIKTMALLKNKPVREGEVIATLEARDIQAQRAETASALEEAQTNLRNVIAGSIPQTAAQDEKALRDARANAENARTVYQRRLKLYEQGGISKKDVDAEGRVLAVALRLPGIGKNDWA